MKTLGALIVIWILYCMYLVTFKPEWEWDDFYHFPFAMIGYGVLLTGVIYLIITYLP